MTSLLAEHGFEVTDSSVTNDEPNRAKDPDYIRHGTPRFRGSIGQTWWSCWSRRACVKAATSTGRSNTPTSKANGLSGSGPRAARRTTSRQRLSSMWDAVVGWQGERIRDAICGEINNWETSEGELRPEREIARHNC